MLGTRLLLLLRQDYRFSPSVRCSRRSSSPAQPVVACLKTRSHRRLISRALSRWDELGKPQSPMAKQRQASVGRWSSISAWDESCTDVELAKYGPTPYPNKVSCRRLAMSEARVQDASGGPGYRLMRQRVRRTLFCPDQSPLGSPYPAAAAICGSS